MKKTAVAMVSAVAGGTLLVSGDAASAATTVRHPVADQAAAMVRLLLGLFSGGPSDPVILPTELVIRESA
ncbi:hypothetical protein [Thermoactinospora rubra]|uniref:hypothetical protein n=1 Tax=Thermoactinospora rubra TaxID=1088767 RepID=UPI000A111BD1|nr:hypothetical protein [Thermoactinospora rubra]